MTGDRADPGDGAGPTGATGCASFLAFAVLYGAGLALFGYAMHHWAPVGCGTGRLRPIGLAGFGLPFLIIGAAALMLRVRRHRAVAALGAATAAALSCGGALAINASVDVSAHTVDTTVAALRTSKPVRGDRRWVVELAPWPPRTEPAAQRIPQELFDSLEEGQAVTVREVRGVLGMVRIEVDR